MPKISVIVPVYKVEAYLSPCVKSILSQTFSDFELWLVDDGSPDRCPQMCDAFAAQDTRVKVLHKKNGGLSDARNAGLLQATGEWIAFIDSDDTVAPRYLAYLLDCALRSHAQLSVCGAVLCPEGQAVPAPPKAEQTVSVYETDEAMSRLFRYEIIPNAWAKLYHRSLFKDGILYPVGRTHEDLFTTYRLFAAAEHIAVGSAPYYHYTIRESSIMGQCRTRIHPDKLAGNEDVARWLLTNKPHLLPDHLHGCYTGFISDAFKITAAGSEKENKGFYRGYRRFAKAYDAYLPHHKKEKLFMFAVSRFPALLKARQMLKHGKES